MSICELNPVVVKLLERVGELEHELRRVQELVGKIDAEIIQQILTPAPAGEVGR